MLKTDLIVRFKVITVAEAIRLSLEVFFAKIFTPSPSSSFEEVRPKQQIFADFTYVLDFENYSSISNKIPNLKKKDRKNAPV